MTDRPPTEPEPQYSGAALQAQVHQMQVVLGTADYGRAVGMLSVSDQEALRELTAVGWYALGLSERLLTAGANVAGRAYAGFHDEIVQAVIAQNYRTIWRVLLSFTSDEALVARAGIMVHRVYDRGTVAARMLGPGHCEMLVTQWPNMPQRALDGLRVAVQAVLTLSRRRGVGVVVARTPAGARYDIHWEA